MTPPAKVSAAIREAAARLGATSDTARLDAELLMTHALGVSRSDLLLRHMAGDVPDGFAALVDRREKHEPVAYIVGHQEFYGRTFAVSPAVLIPRADSETTVRTALDATASPARVLDCGTGSGALLLTLLAECEDAEGIGVDRSPAALETAGTNAAALGLADRARFLQRDWSGSGWTDDIGQFDLVIANPPYVEADARLDPGVRDFEPAGALFAGRDGLDDYRLLIPQLPRLLTGEGVAVLEIGAGQAAQVAQIARSHGFTAVCHEDLGARPRAMVLRLRVGK